MGKIDLSSREKEQHYSHKDYDKYNYLVLSDTFRVIQLFFVFYMIYDMR